MDVVAPDGAVDLIRERGGRLYVWTKRTRCCGGGFSTLDAATEAPPRIQFQRVDEDAGFELFVPVTLGRLPDELHLEARRFPRRIEAYWNGCAWIV
jgi:hypothetical protein